MKQERRFSRREALSVMAVGLGGLSVLASGCGPVNYEVEPTRHPKAPSPEVKPTKPEEAVTERSFQKKVQEGYMVPFKTTDRVVSMFGNPSFSRTVLDSDVAVYRDYKTGTSSPVGGSTRFQNRELVIVTDDFLADADRVVYGSREFLVDVNAQPDIKVKIFNSRGNANIGNYKVYRYQEVKASEVFHPLQLVEPDWSRKVIVMTITTMEDSFATGAGDNARRVILNDHSISIEKKPSGGETFSLRDTYSMRVED